VEHLLSIDVGTTSLKTAIISADGTMVASAHRDYELLTPEPGHVEQEPTEWWSALVQCCKELGERYQREFRSVVGVGLCGQMHTHVYLGHDDKPLSPAITWMDQRSRTLVREMNEKPAVRTVVERETGNALATTYTAPQVACFRRQEPEKWEKVTRVLVAKDYLKFLLTGRLATDFTDASGTLLFDVAHGSWSEQMFELFQIPRDFFPPALPSATVIGKVTTDAAKETGISAGTPVVNGSSDNSATALGAGVLKPGDAVLIIGTAGVASVCTDRPVIDSSHKTLCWSYCLPDHWTTLGITQTAGESLTWFRSAFDSPSPTKSDRTGAGSDIFDQYSSLAGQVAEGSGGLLFLPYLNGERTPYWDPHARGLFFGVGLQTQKAHFVRAIMEGVSFAMRNNIETIEKQGIKIGRLAAVGGGLKSKVWLQILSGILGRDIATVDTPDTALRGVALMTATAVGLFPSAADVVDQTGWGQFGVVPGGEPSESYERQYKVFLKLYENLKEIYPILY